MRIMENNWGKLLKEMVKSKDDIFRGGSTTVDIVKCQYAKFLDFDILGNSLSASGPFLVATLLYSHCDYLDGDNMPWLVTTG